jgi:hypothetical protein
MNEYTCDNWVVIKFNTEEHGIFYKLLVGTSGGYLDGDSWRMNSGITSVEEDKECYYFYGSSGSRYRCYKESYTLRMNNAHIWTQLQGMHNDKVEMMSEDTDWMNMDWMQNAIYNHNK